ncbi:MAG: glycoside hydrolase family 127 protein [Planctomycetaceae bacterium]|nr:glycoside hydrolase family 127 protein [Planctomycetaceae bacterium]
MRSSEVCRYTQLIIIGFLFAALCVRADSLTKEFPLKAQLKAEPKVHAFALHEVKLLDGPFKSAMDRNAAWLKSIEPDRLLSKFRTEAGLEPKAQPYGGWEKDTIAGHSLGHYLSAISMQYAATGDEEFKKRIDYIIDELAACQNAHGDGYLAAYPNGRKVFQEVSRGQIRSKGFDLNGLWVPWYTNHKVMAGLRDAYVYARNEKALGVLTKMADWTINTTKDLTDEQWQNMLACEHGGMNEVLADVYALTGDPNYLETAKKFYHKFVLDPLSQKQDKLAGLHANTQVPKTIGAARIFELAGDENFGTISEFFWNTVVNHYTFVNGGNSANEHFGKPDRLSDPQHDTTETCNTYNMLKLTRHLYARQPKPAYMDYYERALWNHILAHQHPLTGMIMYKGFLDQPAKKNFSTPFDSFWCCVGTGWENHAKYGECIYAYNGESLYINQFIASEVSWKGLHLKQETTFPASDTVKLTVTCDKTITMPLKIRKPFWTDKVTCTLNGKPQEIFADSSDYLVLNRGFANGDVIELKLPMSLRFEAMPDKPERIAFLYGPIVLAADMSNDTPLPLLDGTPQEALARVKPVDGKLLEFVGEKLSLGFEENAQPADVRLIPLYQIADQKYTVYMDAFTADARKAKRAELQAELEKQKAEAARTVDTFRPGEMQSERDHNFDGQNILAGEYAGRKWRHADNGGHMAFDLKVLPDAAMELALTYWGSDAGGRVFDILVNETKIATQTLENVKPGVFTDVTYAIPAELTKGKETIRVKLAAHPGRTAGGIYGARTMKQQP